MGKTPGLREYAPPTWPRRTLHRGCTRKPNPITKKRSTSSRLRLAKSTRTYAHTLTSIGVMYRKQKLYAKAEPLLKDARDPEGTSRGLPPGLRLQPEQPRGPALGRRTGRQGRALYRQAIDIFERCLEETAASQTEAGQFIHFATTRLFLDNHESLKASTAEVYAAAFRWARDRHRARPTPRRPPPTRGSARRSRISALSRCNRRTSGQRPAPAQLRRDVPRAWGNFASNARGLEKKLAGLSESSPCTGLLQSLTPADVQKLLPANAALVDFLGVPGHRVAAFVVTPKSDRSGVESPRREVNLRSLCEGLPVPLSLNRTRPVQGENDESALRRGVGTAHTPHLKDAKLILICPDGPLCEVPFAALRGTGSQEVPHRRSRAGGHSCPRALAPGTAGRTATRQAGRRRACWQSGT